MYFKFAKKEPIVKKANSTTAATTNKKNNLNNKNVKVSKNIELRRGMETYSNPITIIPSGSTVLITGESAKYYKIKYLGKIGYAPKELFLNETFLASSDVLFLKMKKEKFIVYQNQFINLVVSEKYLKLSLMQKEYQVYHI